MRIELKNVTLQYDEKTPTFQGIDLNVETGDFILIQGASGIGKSSLLRLLNRLQEPTAGEIRIDGKPIAEFDVTTLRRKIGYVQQLPVIIDGSVEDNFNLSFRFRSARSQTKPRTETIRQFMDDFLLQEVRLADDAQKLSVGQKQRISLIRMLLLQPEVLLCDEPTSALDAESKEIVESWIERINIEKGIGVILVTHLDFVPKQVKAKKFLLQENGLKKIDD